VTRKPATLAGLTMLALALLTPALTGCDILTGTSDPGAKLPPKEELTRAITKVTGQPFSFTVRQADTRTASGSTDGVKASKTHGLFADPTTGYNFGLDGIRIDRSAWVSLDLGPLAGVLPVYGELNHKWVTVDLKKLPKAVNDAFAPGFKGVLDPLVQGIITADRTSDDHFAGIVDLSKASILLVGRDVITKLGPSAKAVPYTATIDATGTIATFTVKGLDLADKKGIDVTVTFTDVGKPVTITKPKGPVQAPGDLYRLVAGT
jgi:hypothetical protein